MSELIGVLQQIVQEGNKAMNPTDIAYGTVISASPLSIQTDLSLPPIPAAGLVLTSGVVRNEVSVKGGSGGTVVLNEGLSVGDRVVMLKVSKGQRYIVLSKAQ